MKHRLQITLTFLLGCLVGFAIGGQVGMYLTKRIMKGGDIFSIGWASQIATWACEGGTASEASQALNDSLKVMDKVLATKPEPFMARIIRADALMSLTRLALIQEAEGRVDDAKIFWERAAELARATEYKSATPEAIKSFVMRDTNFVSLLTKARQAREKPSK